LARFANSVMFTPAAGGTVDFVVSAAVVGYMTPALAGAPTGVYKYRAESNDLSQWEIGEGTYTSGTTTLTRTTVLYNSAGTGTATGQSGAGTKINFTNPPNVGIVQAVQDTLEIDNAGSFTAPQILQARANIGIPIGQIPGETSNTAATAGKIGEVIEASYGYTGLTSGAAAVNIGAGQIFTPGDWDISAWFTIAAAGATNATNWTFSVSSTSATHDITALDRYQQTRFAGGWIDPIFVPVAGPHQRLFSTNTTLFLVATATFTGGVFSVAGKIRGRRMR